MRRKLLVSFVVVASVAALAVAAGCAATGNGGSAPYGPGGMMGGGNGNGNGGGMMGGGYGAGMMGTAGGPFTGMMGYDQGAGPVRGLADAKRLAEAFAGRYGLHVGEVIQFTRNYYASLLDEQGRGATEVLVFPKTGAVWIEYGPAMMWNTLYGMGGGMMGGGMGSGYGMGMMGGYGAAAEPTVSAVAAVDIAGRWLAARRPGLSVKDADTFPGYYTVETLRGEKIAGMLSVNAYSGAVWYHTWHGKFVAMTE